MKSQVVSHVKKASALPRASSSALCVCFDRRRCLKFFFAAPSCPLDLARIAHPNRRLPVSLVIGDDNEAHSPPCERRQHPAELGPRELLVINLDHRFAPVVPAAI